MIRRPPRSTLDRSSAASDVYKRQLRQLEAGRAISLYGSVECDAVSDHATDDVFYAQDPVSYTHLRAHETVLDLVCRLLLEKKKKNNTT